ncbi:TIGR02391 family protein [Nocardia cyriacigeorgica]|uniref:TIGR02391 family protein n=1 Tax=Nocardia cyriacigeorgica TaxID=135487 RepID=UPI0024568370|nr:TIGR02391 family protein [Nocardia cyriacigeorgica]
MTVFTMGPTQAGLVSADQVRDLPTTDLALALLADLATNPDQVSLYNLMVHANQAFAPAPDRHALLGRVSDAVAWIQSRGLVGPDANGGSGSWGRLTTLGREVAADRSALTKLYASERLAGNIDSALEAKVRTNFNTGDYETACFAAMKEVEVAVRAAAGLDHSVIGVKLMRAAFKPEGGLLTDPAAEGGEKTAMMDLFAGAIGAFKNPASHRTVQFDDAIEAAEIIQLADLLLKIVRRAQTRMGAEG